MPPIKHVGTARLKLTDEIRKMIEAETADKPQPKNESQNGKPNSRHKK